MRSSLLHRISEPTIALALGAIGALLLLVAFAGRPQPFDAPLGVEAGFTVMVLGFLLARSQLGLRPALVAMSPGVAAQLVILSRHQASIGWLGIEMLAVALIELARQRAAAPTKPVVSSRRRAASTPRSHHAAPASA
jgi:membrane-bound ClpP family serine protease